MTSYKNDAINFEVLDITSSNLPKVDLIFCRDCFSALIVQEYI